MKRCIRKPRTVLISILGVATVATPRNMKGLPQRQPRRRAKRSDQVANDATCLLSVSHPYRRSDAARRHAFSCRLARGIWPISKASNLSTPSCAILAALALIASTDRAQVGLSGRRRRRRGGRLFLRTDKVARHVREKHSAAGWPVAVFQDG